MPLWDNPPHRVSSYTSANAGDSAGGHATTYTAAQSAIPCIINTASGSEQALFAQQNLQKFRLLTKQCKPTSNNPLAVSEHRLF